MSNKYTTVEGLISFFEMSVKVEGWADPHSSPSYHAARLLKELVAERDEARWEACKFEAMYEMTSRYNGGELLEEDVERMARELAEEHGWDCLKGHPDATFDPRPHLDSIARDIEDESSFDAPATAAQRIRLAGQEIDRLRTEQYRLAARVAELERDLAQRTAERDEANERIRMSDTSARLAFAVADRDEIVVELKKITADRDRLAARVEEVEQREPLSEMWRELSEYQPIADANGHGKSWARMCRERTANAATAAGNAAEVWDACRAAWAAASAVDLAAEGERALEAAQHAISKIRKAKEATQ